MKNLYEICKEQLLLKPNGEPYTDRGAIKRRLKKFGFKRTEINDKGMKVYAVSEQDIINMNNAALNPDEDLIIQSL